MPSEAYSRLLYYITGSRPALPPIVVSSAATPFCALSRRPRRRIFQTCRPTIAMNVRDAPAAAAIPRSRQQRRVELPHTIVGIVAASTFKKAGKGVFFDRYYLPLFVRVWPRLGLVSKRDGGAKNAAKNLTCSRSTPTAPGRGGARCRRLLRRASSRAARRTPWPSTWKTSPSTRRGI